MTDWKNWSNRGQIPIKAHCSLPDGVTKIGDELEIEISHCGSQDYFTHEINYDSVTIDQIIALIQSSTECYQKIEYHCLSTPLAVSVSKTAGEKMLSLMDRNGTEYWPESLGNSSCNHIYPQWMKDVEYIRDMVGCANKKTKYHILTFLVILVDPDYAQDMLLTKMVSFFQCAAQWLCTKA